MVDEGGGSPIRVHPHPVITSISIDVDEPHALDISLALGQKGRLTWCRVNFLLVGRLLASATVAPAVYILLAVDDAVV